MMPPIPISCYGFVLTNEVEHLVLVMKMSKGQHLRFAEPRNAAPDGFVKNSTIV